MVERLLLDRIDHKAAGASVGGQRELITLPLTNEAKSALTIRKCTEARTELAPDSTVRESAPVSSGMSEGSRLGTHLRKLNELSGNSLACVF